MLDTSRIICLDVMDRLELLRQLKPNFTLSPQRVVCPTDLVFSPRAMLDKIDIADSRGCGADLLCLRWLYEGGDLPPQVGYVFIPWVGFAIGNYTASQLGF
jgi:hypothetical protein